VLYSRRPRTFTPALNFAHIPQAAFCLRSTTNVGCRVPAGCTSNHRVCRQVRRKISQENGADQKHEGIYSTPQTFHVGGRSNPPPTGHGARQEDPKGSFSGATRQRPFKRNLHTCAPDSTRHRDEHQHCTREGIRLFSRKRKVALSKLDQQRFRIYSRKPS
jgi:hypothetical protein